MRYQLHDCKIDSVILEDDAIVLSFPDGFCAEDDSGCDTEPLKHKLVLTIDRACHPDEPLESFVFIRRIKRSRNGWKDISFKRFVSLFQKGHMVIFDEFDSKLTNRKMFQLNAPTSWSNIEMFIEDIADISCL